MKLLILGGGHCQVNAIKRAKIKGYEVVVSDYLKDAPGRNICNYIEEVSTFDVEGNIAAGKKHNIDGIMTLGTDQPVYTAARVSEELNLPFPIDSKVAKAVTNKKVMKNIFRYNNIPTPRFTFINRYFKDEELEAVKFPVVIKPLDSQGQRGVYKLNSIEEIRDSIDEVLGYSREDEVLIEEYYEHDEITVSGWVDDGQTHVLTVTDRVTYNNYPSIGVCTCHNFPSKHLWEYYDEINTITVNLVEAFNIKNGPIYFQMLIGREGIKVNEVACRIGGAYEDELIPMLTGVDILDLVMETSLGRKPKLQALKKYNLKNNNKHASVQLLFVKSGKIAEIRDIEEIKRLPGVINGRFTLKPGQEIPEITNATQRIGYIIITGDNKNTLEENINRVFDNISITDNNGKNLIINFNKQM